MDQVGIIDVLTADHPSTELRENVSESLVGLEAVMGWVDFESLLQRCLQDSHVRSCMDRRPDPNGPVGRARTPSILEAVRSTLELRARAISVARSVPRDVACYQAGSATWGAYFATREALISGEDPSDLDMLFVIENFDVLRHVFPVLIEMGYGQQLDLLRLDMLSTCDPAFISTRGFKNGVEYSFHFLPEDSVDQFVPTDLTTRSDWESVIDFRGNLPRLTHLPTARGVKLSVGAGRWTCLEDGMGYLYELICGGVYAFDKPEWLFAPIDGQLLTGMRPVNGGSRKVEQATNDLRALFNRFVESQADLSWLDVQLPRWGRMPLHKKREILSAIRSSVD